MPATEPSTRRRADAERSVSAVLDAALRALARDPETSMAGIAREAGVARATVYAHFPTREALIAAVTRQAMTESVDALKAAEPERGEPAEALARTLGVSWRTLGRYHALVPINSALGPEHMRELHEPVAQLVRPLLARGRASGAFNAELSVEWMLTVLLELIHAASREVSAGRLPEAEAERVLVASVTGALSARA